MNVAELLAQRARDSQVPKFPDYPKWITVDGTKLVVNSAAEEQAVLGASAAHDEPSSANLLSDPPKRRGCPPGGWPKKTPSDL